MISRRMPVTVAYDLVAESATAAGVQRYARELRLALATRDDTLVVGLGPRPRRRRGAIHRLTQGLVREGWWYPAGLAHAAERARADVLQCMAAFAPERGRTPVVLSVPDVLPLRHPELFPRVIVAHQRATLARRARRAARVITLTEHGRTEAIETLGLVPERVAVTLLGVEPRFRPDPPSAQWLAGRWGIDRPYVLCVGTLEPRKNLLGALQGMRAAGFGDDVVLVIAGGRGWRNEAFESEARKTDVPVIRAGRVSDEELVRLYGGARCLAFPSLWEGYGLPVLEAMACGCPVVSSHRSGLAEVVGDCGLLVDPLDPEAIGAALRVAVADDHRRAELRERGLARARGMTWQRTAAQTVAVHRAVAAESLA